MENTSREHFGVKLVSKNYSLKLCRDEFALISTKPSLSKFDSLANQGAYTDTSGSEYTTEWCERYREICLRNYDRNMYYFQSLDEREFSDEIDAYLVRNGKFKEVKDLKDCAGVTGYYIMVLDEYKQVYIGKSNDIKKRIQQHWSKTKPFDRVLLPMYNEKSVFSIDFFRALDTTRIFVWARSLSDGVERKLINDFPVKFSCNRIGGDVETLAEAAATIKKHEL